MNHNFQITSSGNGAPFFRNLPQLPPIPQAILQDPEAVKRLEVMVNNVLTGNIMSARSDIFNKFLDPRRSIEDDCGFPDARIPISSEEYKVLIEREPVAAKVVEFMARESWKVQPEVYEDEDEEVTKPFENEFFDMCKGLRGEHNWCEDRESNPFFEKLKAVDELSGWGHYGLLLFGFDDFSKGEVPDLRMPIKGFEESNSYPSGAVTNADGSVQMVRRKVNGKTRLVPKLKANQLRKSEGGIYRLVINQQVVRKRKRKLLFLSAFPEHQCDILRWEGNMSSPRYGQPTAYLITLHDNRDLATGYGLPQNSVEVHWSRVLHVADTHHTASPSEVFAVPRLRSTFNNCMSIYKVAGGSGEGYWRSCFAGLALSTHPSLGGDVQIDQAHTRDQLEQYMNTLQRYLVLNGMEANTLAPAVVDPTPFVLIQIQLICIKLNVPQRIFMGSERGELASGQDKGDWDDEVRLRQVMYNSPKLLVPAVNRLIAAGVLSPPEKFYTYWPDLAKKTDAEKADVGLKRAQAITTWVQGGGEATMTLLDFLVGQMGMSQKDARQVIENLEAQSEAELSGEGKDAGKSPLLSTAAGVTAMIELWKLAQAGAVDEEQLRGLIKAFYGLSDDAVDAIIADGLTPLAEETGAGMEAELEKKGMEIEQGLVADPTAVQLEAGEKLGSTAPGAKPKAKPEGK